MRGSVGIKKTIHTEVAVVVALAVVAAVAVLGLAVFSISYNHSVVAPLPNEAAGELIT